MTRIIDRLHSSPQRERWAGSRRNRTIGRDGPRRSSYSLNMLPLLEWRSTVPTTSGSGCPSQTRKTGRMRIGSPTALPTSTAVFSKSIYCLPLLLLFNKLRNHSRISCYEGHQNGIILRSMRTPWLSCMQEPFVKNQSGGRMSFVSKPCSWFSLVTCL